VLSDEAAGLRRECYVDRLPKVREVLLGAADLQVDAA
jgi:hypothetical protein